MRAALAAAAAAAVAAAGGDGFICTDGVGSSLFAEEVFAQAAPIVWCTARARSSCTHCICVVDLK